MEVGIFHSIYIPRNGSERGENSSILPRKTSYSSSSRAAGSEFLRRNVKIFGRKLRNLLLRSRHPSISSMEFLDSRLPLLVLPWNSIFPWKIPNFLPRRVGGIQISNLDFQTSQSGIQKFLPRKSGNPSSSLMESSICWMESKFPILEFKSLRWNSKISSKEIWKSISALDGMIDPLDGILQPASSSHQETSDSHLSSQSLEKFSRPIRWIPRFHS